MVMEKPRMMDPVVGSSTNTMCPFSSVLLFIAALSLNQEVAGQQGISDSAYCSYAN